MTMLTPRSIKSLLVLSLAVWTWQCVVATPKLIIAEHFAVKRKMLARDPNEASPSPDDHLLDISLGVEGAILKYTLRRVKKSAIEYATVIGATWEKAKVGEAFKSDTSISFGRHFTVWTH